MSEVRRRISADYSHADLADRKERSPTKRLSLPPAVSRLCNGVSPDSRLYKVLVIGEIHTGKSSLIRRYVHNFYSDNYCATVGVDFRLKMIPINEDLEVRLQLWDVAGQERFTTMIRPYYSGTMGAIIVFDQTNAYTYQAAVHRWKQALDARCSLPGNRPVPVILVANKADLKRDKNLPDDLEISRCVQEQGFVPRWYKTSAKTGENVNEAMNLIVKYILTLDNWTVGKAVENGHEEEPPIVLSPLEVVPSQQFPDTGKGPHQRQQSRSNCMC